MKRHAILLALALTAAAAAYGQKMPERRDVRRGNRAYEKSNFDRAIGMYNRALEQNPQCFEAGYDLANALYRAERYDTAEQTAVRFAADTLRSDTDRADAFYNLGNIQFAQQKYQEALESYKNAMRLNPDDREAKYNYAFTKKLMQDNQNRQDNQENQDNKDDQNQEGEGQNQPQDGDRNNDEQQQDNRNGGEEPQDGDRNNDRNDGDGDESDSRYPNGDRPQEQGISPQEQEAMLDAIQAQEDKTQDKLKEKQGVIVRGGKNW